MAVNALFTRIRSRARCKVIAAGLLVLAVLALHANVHAQVRWQMPPPDEHARTAGEAAGQRAREQLDAVAVLVFDSETGLFVSVAAFVAGEYQQLFEDLLDSEGMEEFYERRWSRAAELGEGAVAYVLDGAVGALRPLEEWLAENEGTVRTFRRGGARFVDLAGTTGYLVYDASSKAFSSVAEFYRDHGAEINESVLRTARTVFDIGSVGAREASDYVHARRDEIRRVAASAESTLRLAAVTVVASMEIVQRYYLANHDRVMGTAANTLEGMARVASGAAAAVHDFVDTNPEITRAVQDAVQIGPEVAARVAQEALRGAVASVNAAVQSEGMQEIMRRTELAASSAAASAATGAAAAFSSAASAVGGFVSGFFGR